MARPQKNTVDYFPHMVTHGETMFTLENSFGNDGYACWFKILELLGRSEGHFFNFSEKKSWLYLVATLRVTQEVAKGVLDMLADMGAIDAELYAENVIWCENFVEGLRGVYDKRSTEMPLKPSFRPENYSSRVVSGAKSTQSKVKESKVEESNTVEDKSSQGVTGTKYSEEHLQIAEDLFAVTILRKPNKKKPSMKQWAEHIRKMEDIDSVSISEIKTAIGWYRTHWNDSQYIPVIESAKSLREKWDKLANAISRGHMARQQSSDEANPKTKLAQILMEKKYGTSTRDCFDGAIEVAPQIPFKR